MAGMELDELHTIVGTARLDGWAYIPCHGQDSAPLTPAGHTDLLVYRDDVDVTVAFGAAARDREYEDEWLGYGWKAEMFLADLRYRGAVVDRVPLLQVDGLGRAVVPVPSGAEPVDDSDPDAAVLYRVPRLHYDLARLLHLRQGFSLRSFEQMLGRANIIDPRAGEDDGPWPG